MCTSRLTTFDLLAAPLIILAGTVASLWPLLHNIDSGEFIGMGDPWRYAGPVLFYGDYWMHQGELPLWNPLVNCGQPFAANPQSFLFHLPNLIRSLLTFSPTPYRTHIGVLILLVVQMTAGGYGAYLLARAHRLVRGPALAAAFAYGLSGGAITFVIGFWYFHNALMWLPYLLWAMRASLLAVNLKLRLKWAAIAGVAYGAVLLAGTPVYMVFMGLFLGVYVLLHRVVYHPWWERYAARQLFTNLTGDLAVLATVLGIGVLVASPLLLPALEFSSFSDRAGADPSNVERMGENLLRWNLWEILCVYPGDERYQAMRGAGAGIMILALVGLLSKRRKELLIFGGLFLFALDCARDEPLLFGHILVQLAPFKVSGPGRIAPPMCLPLGMLAALGVEALIDATASLTTKRTLTAMILLAGAVVLGTLWATVPPHPLFVFGPLPLVIPAILFIGAIVTVWIRNQRNAGFYLALTVLAEIVIWNQYHVAHFAIANPNGLYPKGVEHLKGPRSMWEDNFRITYPLVNMQMYDLQPAVNGYDPLYIESAASTIAGRELNSFDRVTLPEWVAANKHFGFLKRSFWLTREYAVGELPNSDRPFPYSTTVFLEQPLPPEFVRVDQDNPPMHAFSDDSEIIDLLDGTPIQLNQATRDDERQHRFVTLAENLDTTKHSVLGVSAIAGRQTQVRLLLLDQDTEDDVFLLTPLSIDPYPPYPVTPYQEFALPEFKRARLIARCTPPDEPSAFIQELKLYRDNADESQFIRIEERTANSVRLTIGPLAESRILLFVDAHYPGWKAYVDGISTDILKANKAFKAITLAPGTHDVRFVFKSPRTSVGIGLSLTTLAAVVVMAWRTRKAG